MQFLNVTQLPIFLPADTAQVPFGDPLSDLTVTSATPGVGTVPGYNPTNNDLVAISFASGGSVPTGLTAGTAYFVVGASGDTFNFAATKGGAAIATTSTGSKLTLHLLSQQKYGVTHPFKSGGSAIALNLGATTLTLQSAPDVNSGAPGAIGGYGNPGGPGAYTTIAAIPAGTAALVNLNNDWISLTGAGTLVLLQN